MRATTMISLTLGLALLTFGGVATPAAAAESCGSGSSCCDERDPSPARRLVYCGPVSFVCMFIACP